MDKDYDKAIKETEEKLIDLKKRGQESLGDDALSFIDSLMSPGEIAKMFTCSVNWWTSKSKKWTRYKPKKAWRVKRSQTTNNC